MKKRIAVIGTLLAVFIATGIVLAQDEKPSGQSDRGRSEPKSDQSATQRRPKELDRVYSPNSGRPRPAFGSGRNGQNFGPGRGGFDPRSSRPVPGGNVMQRLEQQVAQRRGAHENAIRELEGIMKVALGEKAEKTAALVQKLIDKKNAEFQKSVDQIKEYRDRIQERMSTPQQSGQKPGYHQPGGRDDPRPDKQKKAPAYSGKKPDQFQSQECEQKGRLRKR